MMLRKFIAVLLSVVYCATQVVFASKPETTFWAERQRRLAALPANPLLSPLPPPSKTFSAALGGFSSASQPAANESSNLKTSQVILVQDIHQNAEAQTQIAQFLLSIDPATHVIGIEGASEFQNFEPYRQLRRPDVVSFHAGEALQRGRMLGSSFAALTKSSPLPIYGVEAPLLYEKHVASYLASDKIRLTVKKALKAQTKRIEQEKARAYSSALKQLDGLLQRYRTGDIGAGPYLQELSASSRAVEPPLSIRIFLEATAMETHMDFKAVEKERAHVLTQLVERMNPTAVQNLIEKSAAFKSGDMGCAVFYKDLRETLTLHQIELNRTPHFAGYLRYIALADGIRAETLLADIRAYEEQVFQAAAKTATERALLLRDRQNDLAKKLVDYALSPEEWEEFKTTLASMPGLQPFIDYYRFAEIRNRALTENLLSAMEKRGARSGVLVAGGFHTKGLTRALNERGVRTSVLPLRLSGPVTGASPLETLTVFQREKSPLEKLFRGEKLFLGATDGIAFNPPLVPVQSAGPEFRRTIATTLREAGSTETEEALLDTTRIKTPQKPADFVSSRAGFKKTAPTEPPEPIEEIEYPVKEAVDDGLAQLQQTHPKLHAMFVDKIRSGDKLNIFWAKNMPSAAGLIAMPGPNGKPPLIGFLLDSDLRSILERESSIKGPERRKAVSTFLYLLVVHEAAELHVRAENEPLEPTVQSKIKATLAEFLALEGMAKEPGVVQGLTDLLVYLDEPNGGEPRFTLIRELWGKVVDGSIRFYEGIFSLIRLLQADPRFRQPDWFLIQEFRKALRQLTTESGNFKFHGYNAQALNGNPDYLMALPQSDYFLGWSKAGHVYIFQLRRNIWTTLVDSGVLAVHRAFDHPIDDLAVSVDGRTLYAAHGGALSIYRIESTDDPSDISGISRLDTKQGVDIKLVAEALRLTNPPPSSFDLSGAHTLEFRPRTDYKDAGLAIQDPKKLEVSRLKMQNPPTSMAVARDGSTVVFTTGDGKIHFTNIRREEIVLPDQFFLGSVEKVGTAHSRLGRIAAVLSGDPEPSDEISAAQDPLVASAFSQALERLEKTHPDHYDTFTRLVPQENRLWAGNLGSAGGVFSMETGKDADGKPIISTGFLLNENLRPLLSTFPAPMAMLFLYLLLVHESAELLARDELQSITPNLQAELRATFAEAGAFHGLNVDEKATLTGMANALDKAIGVPIFFPVIEAFSRYDPNEITVAGVSGLLELIFNDPVYSDMGNPSQNVVENFLTRLLTRPGAARDPLSMTPATRVYGIQDKRDKAVGGDKERIATGFTSDGAYVLAGVGRQIRMYALDDLEAPVKTIPILSDDENDEITVLTVFQSADPGVQRIAVGTREGRVVQVTIAGDLVKTASPPDRIWEITDMAYAPDGKALLVGDKSGTAIVYPIQKVPGASSTDYLITKGLELTPRGTTVCGVDYDPMGRLVLVSRTHGAIDIGDIDIKSGVGEWIASISSDSDPFRSPARFSPDGENIVYISGGRLVTQVLHFSSKKLSRELEMSAPRSFPGQTGNIAESLVSSPSRHLLFDRPSNSQRITGFHVRDVGSLLPVDGAVQGNIAQAAFSPRGERLAVGTDGGRLHVYELSTDLRSEEVSPQTKQFEQIKKEILKRFFGSKTPPRYGRGDIPHREAGGVNDKISEAFRDERTRKVSVPGFSTFVEKNVPDKALQKELLALLKKTEIITVKNPDHLPALYIRGPDRYAVAHFGHNGGRGHFIYVDEQTFRHLEATPSLLHTLLLYELVKLNGGTQEAAEALETAIQGDALRSAVQSMVETAIPNHPLLPSVVDYYVARESLIHSIATGDPGVYEVACGRMAAAAAKVSSLNEHTAETLAGHLKNSADLPFNTDLIGDLSEISRVQESSFDTDPRTRPYWAKIKGELNAYLEALVEDPDLRADLLREIKLVSYPLTVQNVLPRTIEQIAYQPVVLRELLKTFELIVHTHALKLGGFFLVGEGVRYDLSILVTPRSNRTEFKSGYFHEIIHYLAFKNVLPFNFLNETVPQAITAFVTLHEGGREELHRMVGDRAAEFHAMLDALVDTAENLAAEKGGEVPEPAKLERIVNSIIQSTHPDLLTGAGGPQQKEMLERMSGLVLGAFTNARVQKKKGLNGYSLIVAYGKRHLPRVRTDDYARSITTRDRRYIDDLINNRLNPVANILAKSRVEMKPRKPSDLKSPERAVWSYDRRPRRLHYLPWDILAYGEASAGLVAQEMFRGLYSANDVIESQYDHLPFKLLFGFAETIRVLTKGLSLNDGYVQDVNDYYRKRMRIHDLETEKERMAANPRFLQYVEALLSTLINTTEASEPIYDPRVTDPDVMNALVDTFPMVVAALEQNKLGFYRTIRDEVWPVAKTLLDDDMDKLLDNERKRKALNDMLEQGKIEVTEDQPPGTPGEAEDMGDKVRISLSPCAGGKELDMDDLSDKARENLEKAVKEHLERMKKEERRKFDELEEHAKDAAKKKMKQALKEAALENADAAPEAGGGQKTGSPGGTAAPFAKPQDAGGEAGEPSDSGEGKGGAEGGGGSKGPVARDLKKHVKELKDMAGQIGKKAAEIGAEADKTSALAKGVQNKADKIEEEGKATGEVADAVKAAIERLEERLKEMRKMAAEFHDKADDLKKGVEDASNDQAGAGLEASDETAEKIQDLATVVENQTAKADETAAAAKVTADDLKEKLEENVREAIQGRAGKIIEEMMEIKKKLEELQGTVEDAKEESQEFRTGLGHALPSGKRDGPDDGVAEDQDSDNWAFNEGDDDENGPSGDPGIHNAPRGPTPASPGKPARGPRGGVYNPHKKARPELDALREFLKQADGMDLLDDRARKEALGKTIDQATGLTASQRQAYDRVKELTQEFQATLQNSIFRILEEMEQGEWLRHQKKGPLDSRKLPLVPAGVENIHKREIEPDRKVIRVSLLIDLSGSMYSDSYSGENNLNLDRLTDAMLKADTRINNAMKVVILFLETLKAESLKQNADVELEIGGFASNTKIFLPFGTPIREGLAYQVVQDMIKHHLGGDNSDLAGVRMMVDSFHKRDREHGVQPKILVIIADGGIDYSDGPGLQKIMQDNEDIVFIPVGIGPQASDIVNAYKPFGRMVENIKAMVFSVGEWLYEQVDRIRKNNGFSLILLGIIGAFALAKEIPSLFSFDRWEYALMGLMGMVLINKTPKAAGGFSDHFTYVEEYGKTYLVMREGPLYDPQFRIEVSAEVPKDGHNDITILETPTNVKNVKEVIMAMSDYRHHRKFLYLLGEAGAGKNTLIYYAARLARKKVHFMAFHKDLAVEDLSWRRQIGEREAGRTGWALSPLMVAKKQGDWIIFDEFNKADVGVKQRLNQLLIETRTSVQGTWVEEKDGFAVVVTGNPEASGADEKVYQVKGESGEMIDRAMYLLIDYLPIDEELEFLLWVYQKAAGLKELDKSDPMVKLIPKLINAAIRVRDLYFHVDPATGKSEGRGKLVARPLSTRALLNIIRHLVAYPEETKRLRSVIRRYYSYEWSREEQVKNVEEALTSQLGKTEDEPLAFSAADKNGPDYVEVRGVRTLEFKGVRVRTGASAPKSLDDVPPHMRIKWTATNLHHLYDMMMDMSQDRHQLLIGEAGTGKDVIAAYLSYLIQGPSVENFGVTRNAMSEDLIAYLGLGEGEKTGLDGLVVAVPANATNFVDAYVVRAMRAGRPIILTEINKGKPEVFAILNNILQFGWIDLPNGERVYAEPGFMIIGSMNPIDPRGMSSNLGSFELSGEFIDRFSTHPFDYLPPEEELEILRDYNNTLLDKNDGFYQLTDDFLKKLIGFMNKCREKYGKKRELDRPVSMRGAKAVITHFAQRPTSDKKVVKEHVLRNFYFPNPAHREVVEKQFDTAFHGSLGDISEVVSRVKNKALSGAFDTLAAGSKSSAGILNALLIFDLVLEDLAAKGKLSVEDLKNGRDQFRFLTAGFVSPLPGFLPSLLITRIQKRLGGEAPGAELPTIVEERTNAAEWDFASSKDDALREVGQQVRGVLVVDKQKPLVEIIEIDGVPFLAIKKGVKDDHAIEAIARMGRERIDIREMGSEETADLYRQYVEFLTSLNDGKWLKTEAVRLGVEFLMKGVAADAFLAFATNPRINPMLIPGRARTVYAAVNDSKLSDIEKMALLSAIGTVYSERLSAATATEQMFQRRIAELKKLLPITSAVSVAGFVLTALSLVYSRWGLEDTGGTPALEDLVDPVEGEAFQDALKQLGKMDPTKYSYFEPVLANVFWANNMPSAAGLAKYKLKPKESQRALLFDVRLRPCLEKAARQTAADFFFIQLVHEAAENQALLASPSDPLLGEFQSTMIDAATYLNLPEKRREAVRALVAEIDAAEGGERFGALLRLYDAYNPTTIHSDAARRAFIDYILRGPEFKSKKIDGEEWLQKHRMVTTPVGSVPSLTDPFFADESFKEIMNHHLQNLVDDRATNFNELQIGFMAAKGKGSVSAHDPRVVQMKEWSEFLHSLRLSPDKRFAYGFFRHQASGQSEFKILQLDYGWERTLRGGELRVVPTPFVSEVTKWVHPEVRFSPDGQFVAAWSTMDDDNRLFLGRYETTGRFGQFSSVDKFPLPLPVRHGYISAIAFLPEDQGVLVQGGDNGFLWYTLDGTFVASSAPFPRFHGGPSLFLSPNGATVIARSDEKNFEQWDVKLENNAIDFRMRKKINVHPFTNEVHFSPDGKTVNFHVSYWPDDTPGIIPHEIWGWEDVKYWDRSGLPELDRERGIHENILRAREVNSRWGLDLKKPARRPDISDLVDVVDGPLFNRALKKLKKTHPHLHTLLAFAGGVNPTSPGFKIFWGHNLRSLAALHIYEYLSNGGKRCEHAFVFDQAVRPLLQEYANRSGATGREAVANLFYLQLVHETTELDFAGLGGAVTPSIEAEFSAMKADVGVYLALSKTERDQLKKLTQFLDGKLRRAAYAPIIRLYDALTQDSLEEKAGRAALLVHIQKDPVYAKTTKATVARLTSGGSPKLPPPSATGASHPFSDKRKVVYLTRMNRGLTTTFDDSIDQVFMIPSKQTLGVVSGGHLHFLRLVTRADGRMYFMNDKRLFYGHQADLHIFPSPDGKVLVTEDGSVYRLKWGANQFVEGIKTMDRIDGMKDRYIDVFFLKNNKGFRVVSGESYEFTVCEYTIHPRTKKPKLVWKRLMSSPEGISELVFSKDGKHVLFGSADTDAVQVFEIRPRRQDKLILVNDFSNAEKNALARFLRMVTSDLYYWSRLSRNSNIPEVEHNRSAFASSDPPGWSLEGGEMVAVSDRVGTDTHLLHLLTRVHEGELTDSKLAKLKELEAIRDEAALDDTEKHAIPGLELEMQEIMNGRKNAKEYKEPNLAPFFSLSGLAMAFLLPQSAQWVLFGLMMVVIILNYLRKQVPSPHTSKANMWERDRVRGEWEEWRTQVDPFVSTIEHNLGEPSLNVGDLFVRQRLEDQSYANPFARDSHALATEAVSQNPVPVEQVFAMPHRNGASDVRVLTIRNEADLALISPFLSWLGQQRRLGGIAPLPVILNLAGFAQYGASPQVEAALNVQIKDKIRESGVSAAVPIFSGSDGISIRQDSLDLVDSRMVRRLIQSQLEGDMQLTYYLTGLDVQFGEDDVSAAVTVVLIRTLAGMAAAMAIDDYMRLQQQALQLFEQAA